MSVVYCETCDNDIDTDYEAEHFVYGTEICASLDDDEDRSDEYRELEGDRRE